jgi:tetratricopeptide (TPR) repeat protein
MSLESEDIYHLRAAQGYVELGMYEDAIAELGEIASEYSDLDELIAVRIAIHGGKKEWGSMQTEAKKMLDRDPSNPQWAISLAYATRRAQTIEAAKTILLDAVEKHPDEAMIRYNLACYECQLGKLETAKEYLDQAVTLEPKCRMIAMEDSDLEPLWGALH